MTFFRKIFISLICLGLAQFSLSQNLVFNGDFELGTNGGCDCATNFTCSNDAGRVVDGVHPLYTPGNNGCIGGTTNFTNPLGAHSGVGYIYFYAGLDNIISSNINFGAATQVDICVWYAGPQGAGGSGQNTANCNFKLAVDGVQVGPNVLVPSNTIWTQHCFTLTVSAGSHNFGILSGGFAAYSIWFDDFSVIPANALPVVDLGNDTTLCPGQTLTLNAANPNATYLWQDNSTNPTYTVTQPGTYWVAVTNGAGTVSDTISVAYVSLPTVDLGNDTSLCPGATLLLDATTPNATYLWQNNSTNPTLNVFQQGNYSVTVTINNCSTSDAINVSFNSSPLADLGNDTSLCAGEVLTLDVTMPNASYLWQDNSVNPVFNVTQPGSYSVSVTVSGCSSADTINVQFNPSPVVDLGNDTSLCTGGVFVLDATTAGATYLWQDLSNGPAFTVTQQGAYWVSITVSGCSAIDSINVFYITIPVVDLGNDTAICPGTYLILNAGNTGASYVWQDASVGQTYTVYAGGLYWVNVNASGCIGRDSIVVNYKAGPSVNLGDNSVICENSNLLLDANFPGAAYLWQDGSTGATFNVTAPGTYWVNLTYNGCNKFDTITITESNCNIMLYIPNIFTPNDDGQNDILFARGEGIKEIVFAIYDRWGERVFESTDLAVGWDGTFHGKQCNADVYVYYVKVEFVDDTKERRKGSVTLAR